MKWRRFVCFERRWEINPSSCDTGCTERPGEVERLSYRSTKVWVFTGVKDDRVYATLSDANTRDQESGDELVRWTAAMSEQLKQERLLWASNWSRNDGCDERGVTGASSWNRSDYCDEQVVAGVVVAGVVEIEKRLVRKIWSVEIMLCVDWCDEHDCIHGCEILMGNWVGESLSSSSNKASSPLLFHTVPQRFLLYYNRWASVLHYKTDRRVVFS
jgi:hypothetical protein